jgi:hypothetical protein
MQEDEHQEEQRKQPQFEETTPKPLVNNNNNNEPTIKIINTDSLYSNHSLISHTQIPTLKNSVSLQSNTRSYTRASISNASSNANNLLTPNTLPSNHSCNTHRRESFLYKFDGEFDAIPTKLALNARHHLEQ